MISSIGLFDIVGLASENPTLALGSPLFDKVTIKLNKRYYPGDTFVIKTKIIIRQMSMYRNIA